MTWIPGLPGSLDGFTLTATIAVAIALLIAAVIVALTVIREQEHCCSKELLAATSCNNRATQSSRVTVTLGQHHSLITVDQYHRFCKAALRHWIIP